jgi:hypothetical protein
MSDTTDALESMLSHFDDPIDDAPSASQENPAMTETVENMIDFLTFASYRYNRIQAPQIAPERWRAVFVAADALEACYQAELAGAGLLRETFSGHGFGD